jgi:SAM-dependent methyltransferase
VDQVVDLNTIPWPWETSAIQEILAEDALEHLCPLGPGAGNFNIPHLMKEIYRVLEPGGIINIKVPSTDGRGAWQDPTHITFWNLNSFSYMDPRSPTWELYEPPYKFRIESLVETFGDPEIVWVRAKLRAMK